VSKFQFPTDLKYVKEAGRQVLDDLQNLGLDEGAMFNIKLCFEEAFINAVKYGNKQDPNKTVDVDVIVEDQCITMEMRDYGEGFDPNNCEDPTKDENLTKLSGRGIFLIKKLMDEVEYDQDDHCLRMRKRINNS